MFTIMRVAVLSRPKRAHVSIDKTHKDEKTKKEENEWRDENFFNDP